MDAKPCDLIVIGSGASGLCTAIVAATEGANVIVLENAAWIGGTSAMSGGGVWIPANRIIAPTDSEQAAQRAQSYLRQVIGEECDDEVIADFLNRGREAIDYLLKHSRVRFSRRLVSPDYYSELPDATRTSRALDTCEFDGRILGSDLALLHPPRPETTLFGGMAVSAADIGNLRAMFRSPVAFAQSVCLVTRYLTRRLRYGRDTRLVLGQALMGRLFASARDLGIDILSCAKVDELILEEGAVCGAQLSVDGRPLLLRARLGVVLATGGFGHNPTMLADWVPGGVRHLAAGASETLGDGIKLALDAGGTIERREFRDSAYWVPMSEWQRPDGSSATFPHFMTDRSKPGFIAVDPQGQRFVNEADSYHDFVRAMHARSLTHAFLVCDAIGMRRFGLGLARPWPFSRRQLIRDGYLLEASSLRNLAVKMGMEPKTLELTLGRHNVDAISGTDREFGKGSSPYNRAMGDPLQALNPCLAPIDKSPFYAVRIYPGNLGTSRGLRTDRLARVLDQQGYPIDGLYAVGGDADAIFGGAYPGPGASLGQAIVRGYVAARHATRIDCDSPV